MKKRIFAILLFTFVLFISFKITNANAYLTYHQGSSEYGLMPYYSSNLDVIKEDLTFDIVDFPIPWDKNTDYKSKVTAEYTIKNSGSEVENVRLLFPYGEDPYYMYYDEEYSRDKVYSVEINNEKINLEHRYSLNNYDESYIDELERIKDTKIHDSYFNNDLVMYQYNVTVDTKYNNAYFTLNIENDVDYKILSEDYFNFSRNKKTSNITLSTHINYSPDYYELYILGSSSDSFKDSIKIYENYEMKKEVKADIEVSLIRSISFDDFIEENFGNNYYNIYNDQFAYIDFYNAVIENLSNYRKDEIYIGSVYNQINIMNECLNWLDYDISIAPGETIINKVVAPIYPDIDISYEPYYYTYNYVLSPASTWHSFKNLTIKVNTNLFMDNSTFNFTQEDGIFVATSADLPNCELQFRLCEVQNPEYHPYKSNYGAGFYLLVGFIILVFAIALAGCVATIVFIIINIIKKRRINVFRMFEILNLLLLLSHLFFAYEYGVILIFTFISIVMLILENIIFKQKIFSRMILLILSSVIFMLGLNCTYVTNDVTVFVIIIYCLFNATLLIINSAKYKKQLKQNKTTE